MLTVWIFMNQICRQWFLISHKMTYNGSTSWNYGLSNLKAELKADLIANWYIFQETLCKTWFWTVTSRWRHSDEFNVIFEINRHIFLVLLLLTLNIVFWQSTLWGKLHNCNLLSCRKETPPETSLGFFSRAN